jgi:hypothetical protein
MAEDNVDAPAAPAAATTPEPDAVTPVTEPAVDDVTAKLLELGVDSVAVDNIMNQLGVATVDDLKMLTEADLVSAGLKVVQARKLIGAVAPVATVADASALGAAAFDTILPTVASDESWLEALKAGGVLKVDQSTVTAAIRAALANKVGLFDIPAKLTEAMEQFADANDEQVDASFYALRKQITRRSYAEVFAAIDGLDGNFVTDARKKQLFERVNHYLWPAIIGFHGQLQGWQEAWMQGAANPAMLMAAFMPGSVGMPPGMMAPPETAVLRDSADAVTDAINRVFAGTGVQIASALAYDAVQIKKSLENPRLPAMIGAANREQMLKQLGVAVSATYPRLETNLTRFVLAILQAKDQPAGNEEYQYFGTLCMLGQQIPWDQLGRGSHTLTGVAGPTRL